MRKNLIIISLFLFFSLMSRSWGLEISSTSVKYEKDSLDLISFVEEARWEGADLIISIVGRGECTGDCFWDVGLSGDKINLTRQFKDQKYPRRCGKALLKEPLYKSRIRVQSIKKENYQIVLGNDSMRLNADNTISDYCDQRVNYDCYLCHFFQVYKEKSPRSIPPKIEFSTPQEEKIVSQNPLFLTYFKGEMASDTDVFKIAFDQKNKGIEITEIKDDGRSISGNLYEAEGSSFKGAIKNYVRIHESRKASAAKVKARLGLNVIEVDGDVSMKVLLNGERIFYRDFGIDFLDRPGSGSFRFDSELPTIKNISKEEFIHLVGLAKTAYEIIKDIPNLAYFPELTTIKKEVKQARVYVKLLPGLKASERFIQVHNRTITVPIGKDFQIDLVTQTYKEVQ